MTLDEFNEKIGDFGAVLLVDDDEVDPNVELTLQEIVPDSLLSEPVLETSRIKLSSGLNNFTHALDMTEYFAPDERCFSIRDLLKAIESHEQITRKHSEWFDQIDRAHVYFEGLRSLDDGESFEIMWGS